jgi:hypothetical protein
MKSLGHGLREWGLALCAGAALFGCGQNTGLTLKILTPPDDDPFAGATTAVLTVQGDQMSAQQTTASVTSGRFNAMLELSSPSMDGYVYVKVEALDSSGQAVGRGRTPNFVLPSSDTEVTVYVGRPGQVTATAARLPDDTGSEATPVGRQLLAGASLRGQRMTPTNEPSIGALIVGGINDSGQSMAHAWRYSPITHDFIDSGSAQMARSGAVLVPSADALTGHQALMWGGADGAGRMITTADMFDPQVADVNSLWAAPSPELADAGGPGAYLPTVVEVKDSEFLISGGRNQQAEAGSVALSGAVMVIRVPGATSDVAAKLGVQRLAPTSGMGPMLAPRIFHSATPVTVSGVSSALLFGGLSLDDETNGKPVAEFFEESTDGKTFQPLKWTGTPPVSRRGHVAVTLRSNRVLVAGGYTVDASGAKTVLDSALLIDLGTSGFTEHPMFLKTARYGASITLLTTEIVICGGFDQSGVPLKTCEEFAAADTLDRIGDLFTMPRSRAGHLALPLETDQVLLVGGVGDGGKPLADVDIYTAR